MKLENCVDILSGFAFKSKLFNTEEKGLPIIRIRDVTSNSVSTYYDGDYKDEFIISNGDLLIGMDGQFKLIEWQGGQALLNQRVCKVTPKEGKADKNFLKHLVPKSLKEIEDRTSFVTVKHLSVKKIKDIELPKLPLKTQQHIAQILDDAAALRDKTKQLLTEYDLLAQSIFLEMFGDPGGNSKGWNVYNINEISKRIQIGPFGTQLHQSDYKDYGVSLVNPTDIKDGQIDLENCRKIDEAKFNSLPNYHLEIGDIIIARRGDLSKMTVIQKENLFCGTGSLYIRFNNNINSVFALYYLTHKTTVLRLYEKARGITMANLNKTIIKEFEIIVPPIELQNQFAEKIALIEQQKELAKQELKESEDLFNSLLQKAFKGELVSQTF